MAKSGTMTGRRDAWGPITFNSPNKANWAANAASRCRRGARHSAEFREWLVAGEEVLRTSGQVVERLLAADTEELMQ